MTSIRRTLLLSLLAGLLICTVGITLFAYDGARRELRELFGENMRRMASVIQSQAFHQNPPQINSASPDKSEDLEESFVVQVWDNQPKLVRSSPPQIDLPLQSQQGFSTLKAHGQAWLVYTLKVDGGFVQVAQPKEMVATMVAESAAQSMLPFFILFILLSVGAWFLVDHTLSPLTSLSKNIASREVDQLESLPLSSVPQEVRPLVRALNALLERLDKAMTMQRQFTADAAHELRTPLTAISLQLEVLKRAQSNEDRHTAIEKLSAGVERCVHLANQLLSASRSTETKMRRDFQKVDLSKITRSSLAALAPLVTAKNLELTLEALEHCEIRGDEEGLRSLVTNLADNAIRYTPAGGRITILLTKGGGTTILCVSDTGPGIPKEQRERIFQRFYRLPGTNSTGSGLGLAIVKNIAEIHEAGISVRAGPDNKGTTFEIAFTA